MPKTLHAIVGILGTLKADCIYVPIDPQSPAQRVRKVVDQCDPKIWLVDGTTRRLLQEVMEQDMPSLPAVGLLGSEALEIDRISPRFTQRDYEQYPDHPPHYENAASDPAYIMFTSGSTGTPKGVVITHENVGHYLRWATRYFGLTSSDRMSSHPPLHFDLSVMDVFGALEAGAELHLVPHELNLLPNKMAEFIRESALTQWFSVPSLLNYMAKFDVVKPDDFSALRRILWCGEVFPTPALIYWMTRLPHVTFTNLYGPTEATIASSYYTVPVCPSDGRAQIPIGTACEGEELLVLDDLLHPTPVGQVGNLYIGGVGLSSGYWNDPAKTESAFIFCLAHSSGRIYRTGDLASVGTDGLVYFHGRADTQIKSRGYRIELGEIEAALHALPSLRESAVVAVEREGFEGLTICCAYVPADGHSVTPQNVRQALTWVVPSYMVPAHYLPCDVLPKNASGKIDRPQLREKFKQLSVRTSA
jgi:amino acid adenylation domain-containing protein